MLGYLEKLGKIGFVLPGGFMRGAFQVGALKTFEDRRVIPSYIVGTSAGAINGAAFAAGKMEKLYRTYQDIAKNPHRHVYRWNFYALLKAFFWSESLLTNTPLRRVILNDINVQDLVASPIKIDIITSDFQSGEPVVFSNKNPEHQRTDILANALLASAAVPTVFPPFRFHGHQLFDGGVLKQAPLTYAIREKCDTVFVIMNDRIDTMATEELFRSIYAIGRRTATLIEWTTTKRTIERAHETNFDVDSYLELKKQVIERVSACTNGISGEAKEAIEKVFSESALSIRSKRKVAVHVLSPNLEGRKSHQSRVLDYKIIPHLLERGEQDAALLLSNLEKELS